MVFERGGDVSILVNVKAKVLKYIFLIYTFKISVGKIRRLQQDEKLG